MNNFFLLNEALNCPSVEGLENGISELNEVVIAREAGCDYLMKHESVWEYETVHGAVFEFYFQVVSKEIQRIVPIVFESLHTYEHYISNEDRFAALFPDDCNGFLGIDFAGTAINAPKQITNVRQFHVFKHECLLEAFAASEDDLLRILGLLYPTYQFELQAVKDILFWNQQRNGSYRRVCELLTDIVKHPFMGGFGKTEALKGTGGVASKRLDDENRITYSLKGNVITVFACRGHYA